MSAVAPVWKSGYTPDQLAAMFERLAQEWRDQAGYFSRSDQIATVPAYQRIIGLGLPVLPLILESLRRKPEHWFWALRAITGEDPVPPEDRGNIDRMAAAWVAWGEREGLIPTVPVASPIVVTVSR